MPQRVNHLKIDQIAAATDTGRLLIFPLQDLPILPRGKGVKILNIPGGKGDQENLVSVVALPPGAHLMVYAGKRHLNMKAADYAPYFGSRALRGNKLPRGFQNVVGLEVG
jgi:topoisomerase-4 subunit A